MVWAGDSVAFEAEDLFWLGACWYFDFLFSMNGFDFYGVSEYGLENMNFYFCVDVCAFTAEVW